MDQQEGWSLQGVHLQAASGCKGLGHAPPPQPQAVPPPKPAKKAAKPPRQPSEPSRPKAVAGTEDTRKRPRSPLDEEALAKRVAAEMAEQVRGVLEKAESAEGHGGSGSGNGSGVDLRGDPRGARAKRRSGVQTEAQTVALEAVIKDLVAKNQALQSDRCDMVMEFEVAKGRGEVLQEQLTALQTTMGELEEDRNFIRGTTRSIQAAPHPPPPVQDPRGLNDSYPPPLPPPDQLLRMSSPRSGPCSARCTAFFREYPYLGWCLGCGAAPPPPK